MKPHILLLFSPQVGRGGLDARSFGLELGRDTGVLGAEIVDLLSEADGIRLRTLELPPEPARRRPPEEKSDENAGDDRDDRRPECPSAHARASLPVGRKDDPDQCVTPGRRFAAESSTEQYHGVIAPPYHVVIKWTSP